MVTDKAQLVGALAVVLLLSSGAAAPPPCSLVVSELSSCLSFITKRSSEPSKPCCIGVGNMAAKAKTPADREAICRCAKAALVEVPDYDPRLISQLPQKCGASVKLPPIGPKTDCSK
ncbi:hypothetical protein Nepgr_024389 [Nepenthes gracilis]|uniref:Non-specific lipid-transfer protein n=1 Tax=Nepenthes gracilis TaxID=150966 RepID=A0AAD3Y0F8_NEPGR|nr:hypothetical protein Nepgr_024389 [Nepenthes gracilis]